MYKIYIVRKKDISNCTYNMVDLELPSGLKWADRNVGASSPEDFGSYFQWGDTNAYTYDGVGEVTAAELVEILNPLLSPELGEELTADNVGMVLEQMGMTGTDLTPTGILGVLGKFFNWDSYKEVDVFTGWEEYENGRYPTGFKKYNNNGGLTVLESVDDAATVHMGSNYRMPTSAEIQELISGTTQSFIDIDGNEYSKEQAQNDAISERNLKGVKFTGSNDNSIFIPAAGFCDGTLLIGTNYNSALWSSSLNDSPWAWSLGFNGGGYVYDVSNDRYYGHSVRGVQA